jgi:hypothetical protein
MCEMNWVQRQPPRLCFVNQSNYFDKVPSTVMLHLSTTGVMYESDATLKSRPKLSIVPVVVHVPLFDVAEVRHMKVALLHYLQGSYQY